MDVGKKNGLIGLKKKKKKENPSPHDDSAFRHNHERI